METMTSDKFCACQECVYERALARVSVSKLPIEVMLYAEPLGRRTGQAAAAIAVKEREGGYMSVLRTSVPIRAAGEATTEDEVIAKIRQAIENTLLHELDECWRVDGKQTRDPHDGVVASCLACFTVYKVDDAIERHRHGQH